MPEENQTASPTFARPSARAATMPVQRGNYGIPPRQAAPTAAPQSGPLMMDIAPRRPAPVPAPAPVTPQPAPQPAAPAPITNPAPGPVQPAAPAPTPVQSAQTPLFTSAPKPAVQSNKKVRFRRLRKYGTKIKFALLIVGVLLTLGGLARLFTVTDTSKYNVGVAAVVTNDSSTMTMQFTADDGKLHKFTAPSNPNMIPGTAVEITYRPGAADNTIMQVSTLKKAHNVGVALVSSGIFLLVVAGIIFVVTFRRKPKLTAPTPVAVAA